MEVDQMQRAISNTWVRNYIHCTCTLNNCVQIMNEILRIIQLTSSWTRSLQMRLPLDYQHHKKVMFRFIVCLYMCIIMVCVYMCIIMVCVCVCVGGGGGFSVTFSCNIIIPYVTFSSTGSRSSTRVIHCYATC